MTSQSRDKNATVIGSSYSDGTLGSVHLNRNYEAVYVSSAEEELKEKVQQLEADLNFLRAMLIDIYDKCPKMKNTFSGGEKKKKEDTVECENCGGLLW